MDMLILFKRLLTKGMYVNAKSENGKMSLIKGRKPKHLKLTYLSNYLNKMGQKQTNLKMQ